MAIDSKPVIVAVAFPIPGHTAPVLQICEYLAQRGFKAIYFITGADFKASIEKLGAEFIENRWPWKSFIANAPTQADPLWDMKHIFGDSMPLVHRLLKKTLERVRREHPHREVLILHESLSSSLLPFVYGAPLPKGYTAMPRVITFHTSVNATMHETLPPFGPGLPYDPTPENLALWGSIGEQVKPLLADVVEHYNKHLQALGATRRMTGSFFDMFTTTGDVTLMATSPSLEYPLSVPNPKLHLIGGLPLKPLSPTFVFPSWWPTVTANAALPAGSPDKKKLVFVTQGTIHRDYSELVVPTIRALADRTDLIVVATLGARGAELDGADIHVPANTIVVDYFPYDAVLAHADVFVSNAGYGGFMQGIMNGVPMVLAGTVADKAEVSARAEYAGVAVNLRAQQPGEEAIRAAVEKVLGEPSFEMRTRGLKEENEALDSMGTVKRIVEELMEAE
ncbi:glycosyltransferase family 1 protein [Parathielavia hyrcaniae]|uniref:Glycosyltransferase family 1 protein n=1 Tax=Parathielavia hyrcaniae TaxID=113614 RepID=A0AAN6SXC4_9PEZI|nr:glycosyltransferase family 1 protein [Parathielavia hyrcaniae]